MDKERDEQEWDWDPTRPKWEQIAEIIQDRIARGVYRPRMLILEVRLAEEFGVARLTVRKAIHDLRDRGVLVTARGIGSSVPPEPETNSDS